MTQTAAQIISAAEEHLRTARFGLQDMKVPARRRPGLLNVIVFGRSATFALQNIKSIVPEFEDWYAKKQEEMRSDSLMKYFNELRRKIEHEAHTPGTTGVYISHFTPDMLGPAPPGAIAAFVGDKYGRSGWEVRMPDGMTEKYYVNIPSVEATMTLADAPGPGDKDAAALAEIYLEKVFSVIAEARERFVR